MKKILSSMMACACLIGFSACDSFLDEEPKSQLTSNSYYLSEAHAQQNVNYLYRTGAPTHSATAQGGYLSSRASLDAILTGYFFNDYEGQETACQYTRELTRQSQVQTISNSMDGIWDNCYKAINVANGAILNIPNIDMDATKKATLVAEAQFFRAWNYFYLVKTFGAVPFYTEPSSVDNMMLERTPVEQIYPTIEADLKAAVDNLPAEMFYENNCRVTKYAAAMLLTQVYMFEHKYSDAATYAKMVIASPHKLTQHAEAITAANYEDTKMGSAWNQIRTTDGLAESIYSYEFTAGISSSGWWTCSAFDGDFYKLGSKLIKYSITERTCGPYARFLNIYNTNDLRVQPNQFFHWTYTFAADPTLVWNRDPEKGPGCWFYYDENAMLVSGVGDQDPDFFRYAEALLYGAEAIVAAGNSVTDEAAGYLAQVKARANMEGKTADAIKAELLTLTPTAFIEECWTERLREMPLEFKIWDDCIRTGKFPNISTDTPGKVTYVNLVGAVNGSGATFKDSDLLWPISINEIQRNPNLTQNPGY